MPSKHSENSQPIGPIVKRSKGNCVLITTPELSYHLYCNILWNAIF
jgi:hypothetical protein